MQWRKWIWSTYLTSQEYEKLVVHIYPIFVIFYICFIFEVKIVLKRWSIFSPFFFYFYWILSRAKNHFFIFLNPLNIWEDFYLVIEYSVLRIGIWINEIYIRIPLKLNVNQWSSHTEINSVIIYFSYMSLSIEVKHSFLIYNYQELMRKVINYLYLKIKNSLFMIIKIIRLSYQWKIMQSD